MKDAPRIVAPATFALEAQTKSQSTPNLDLCFALTLTRTCAYTLNYLGNKCRWGATVAGEQVSGEHHSCYQMKKSDLPVIDITLRMMVRLILSSSNRILLATTDFSCNSAAAVGVED
jgi:hypothetical protein